MDFTRREDALKEALIKNEEEKLRWETFKKENEKASENMKMFLKKLNVEVLVPVGGGKAFMPGYLYHTNEILVGHYNGLFSKCSTFKAQEIAKYRLKLADELLDKLEKEKEMFQDKLEIPYSSGVLPEENQQDIIEECSEEELKSWREKHKENVRRYKQKGEKEQEQDNEIKDDEDIMERLEQLELIEELENEYENIECDDSSALLEKILSGEMKLPPRKNRISFTNPDSNVVLGGGKNNAEENDNEIPINDKKSLDSSYLGSNTSSTNDFTNNNHVPNLEDFRQKNKNQQHDSSENSDDSNNEHEEYDFIENEIKNMSIKQKIKYLKEKRKETDINLDTIDIKNIEDYENMLSLLELRDYLIDRILILKDEQEIENDNIEQNHNKNKSILKNSNVTNKLNTKKISFALEDEIQFIDKDESVENMMKSKNQQQKDIIVLDSEIFPDNKLNEFKNENLNKNEIIDKKTLILNEVEKSYNFVSENQSQQDFDLVGKILNESESTIEKTFYIDFKHSDNIFIYPGYDIKSSEENVIGSPADIYRMYPQHFSKEYQIQMENENELLKQNRMKHSQEEKIEQNVFDVGNNEKTLKQIELGSEQKDEELKNHDNKQNEENLKQLQAGEKKSILKNKEAVELETHIKEEKQQQQQEQQQQKKKKKNKSDPNYMCYEMIVGDVVENPSKPPLQEPEPLPEGNFVDAHAPKKRISRFKQIRDSNVKIKS